jgi:hypothetical protein
MLVMKTLTKPSWFDTRIEKVTTVREMEHQMTGDPPGLVINSN